MDRAEQRVGFFQRLSFWSPKSHPYVFPGGQGLRGEGHLPMRQQTERSLGPGPSTVCLAEPEPGREHPAFAWGGRGAIVKGVGPQIHAPPPP